MPRPVHRSQARKFLGGLVALAVLGAVGFVGLSATGGGELPIKSYTYVRGAFEDVGVLRPQQLVKQNGVTIGRVSALDYQNGKAIVTMRLDGERAVHRDARADVRDASALGRKYVEFMPGTPSAGLLDDRVIPVSRTSDSTAIDDVFAAFDRRTRKALSSSLVELGGGMAGRGEDLRSVMRAAPGMLSDLGEVSGTLASEHADLPSLLKSANRLAGRFEARQHELGALLRQADTTFRAVSVDNGLPLHEVVQSLPDTLRQARQGLRALHQPLADVHSAMDTVRPGGRALGASVENLRGFLREAVGPLNAVPGVSDKATPAVEDLTHTVTDARPLVPRLSRTVGYARVLLNDLVPYAPDMGRFFSQHDLLSGQVAPGKHYFSLMIALPGLYNVSAPDPTVERVPYPEPGGGAWRDDVGGER